MHMAATSPRCGYDMDRVAKLIRRPSHHGELYKGLPSHFKRLPYPLSPTSTISTPDPVKAQPIHNEEPPHPHTLPSPHNNRSKPTSCVSINYRKPSRLPRCNLRNRQERSTNLLPQSPKTTRLPWCNMRSRPQRPTYLLSREARRIRYGFHDGC